MTSDLYVQVISGDGEVVAVMKEGSLFGEVELMHQPILHVSHTWALLLGKPGS